jgi:hypothetical protein
MLDTVPIFEPPGAIASVALEFKPMRKKRVLYAPVDAIDRLVPMTYYTHSSEGAIEVVTVIRGSEETRNVCSTNDTVICAAAGEKYVVPAKKFGTLYDAVEGGVVPSQAIRYGGAFEKGCGAIAVPWGDIVVVRKGDVIVREGEGKFYRIDAEEFARTYEFFKPTLYVSAHTPVPRKASHCARTPRAAHTWAADTAPR